MFMFCFKNEELVIKPKIKGKRITVFKLFSIIL